MGVYLLISWDDLIKDLKKLKIYNAKLDNIWFPTSLDICNNAYNVIVSERSVGKTTNILALGMLANIRYGTIMHYVREDKRQVVNAKISNIFNTMISLDFISIITNKKWNYVVYKPMEKKFYYANYDGEKVIDVSSNYFMYVMSIDMSEEYKSCYTCNYADMIIFDEFCSKNFYRQNNFIKFLDLVKTLQRERDTPRIFMLSNTIDRESEYFDELEARDFINVASLGDKVTYKTSLGTPVYIEIVKVKHSDKKRMLNKFFYGFSNPKLASITGQDWSTSAYQHINFNRDDYEIILNNIYVLVAKVYIKLDVVYHDKLGYIVLVHNTKPPMWDDAIIYTYGDTPDLRYKFLLGTTKFDIFIWQTLYKNNKFYYQNNNLGSKIDFYYKTSKKYFINRM